MQKELRCPKCGGAHIVEDDCYDIIHGENHALRELYCGHCKDCGIDVQWEMVYQFIGYDGIEEE